MGECWCCEILGHGAFLLCGCVGQNLDKEVKFDLMAGDRDKKRSLEAQVLRSFALKIVIFIQIRF